METPLDAVDYDEQRGTVIVDRTRISGDAVTAAGAEGGELVYRSRDFGDGATAVSLDVAATGPGSLILRTSDGTALATVDVTATGGVHDYVTLRSDIRLAGVQNLHVEVSGPVRLALIAFAR
ncbi:hypothetical protein GCM10010271_69480 [Streptomyces kurssanovii]|nr:hypothetical protein GCM10010271_69480 [Streptomyces kurssanovii]